MLKAAIENPKTKPARVLGKQAGKAVQLLWNESTLGENREEIVGSPRLSSRSLSISPSLPTHAQTDYFTLIPECSDAGWDEG